MILSVPALAVITLFFPHEAQAAALLSVLPWLRGNSAETKLGLSFLLCDSEKRAVRVSTNITFI